MIIIFVIKLDRDGSIIELILKDDTRFEAYICGSILIEGIISR